MSASISHYCQRCLAANPLGQDFCARCGTRLMIVVDPRGSRYEINEANISTDEHLLERISALENRVTRLTERLERGLDLLLRHAQNSYFDRSLVKALIGLLTDDGLVESEKLEKVWGEHCQQDAVEQEESVQRDEVRLRILAAFNGANRSGFEEIVNEGFLLIEDKQVEAGVLVLKRAAQMAEGNACLDLFMGEYFFRNGKVKLAREHLARAHGAAPEDMRLSLLLGLTCADDGDLELAKKLLHNATERGGSSFAAHYGLGRLFVAEKNWPDALREFKRALSSKPSPEAHYVLACLYYQLGRYIPATRHVRKALDMDPKYREAIRLMTLIYSRRGQQKAGASTGAKGGPRIATGAKSLRGRRKSTNSGPSVAPLFKVSSAHSSRLITGADRRLAEALRADALKT